MKTQYSRYCDTINGEKLKVFSIESGIRQEVPTLTILTQFSVESLRKIWQDKKKIKDLQIRKK